MKKQIVYIALVCFALFSCKNETVIKLKADFDCVEYLSIGDTFKVINKCTNATEYFWDFGDGTTSILNAPTHIYQKIGDVNVKLIAFKGELRDSVIKTINIQNIKPISNFTVYSTDSIPLIFEKITFNNTSKYSTSCLWDFGDGITSTENNPLHSYSKTGNYTIKLTSYNEKGNNTIEKNITITDIKRLNPNTTEIDVDGDNKRDLSFFIGGSGTTCHYIANQVSSYNGYHIIIDRNLDPGIVLPKIYLFGQTIDPNSEEYSDRTLIARSSMCGINTSVWVKDEIRYIGFYKVVDGKIKIGWIKLKVINVYTNQFYSFKIPTICENNLIITK